MPSAGQISFVYDQTRMRWMTSLTSGRFQLPLNLTEGNTIDFVFRLSNNGVLFTPALTPVWIFGIKDADTPNGDFLIQVNSATASSGVFTFVVELASAELQTWLATATSQSYAAIQITDSANDIATGPLLCQIEPNQNDTGTTPTSANGTLSVAAGKTVTFPQSLTFPSALGTNGFQLTTDGAGALTWAASGALTDGDKGDITVSASGATWTIDNDVITLAKLAHMATARVVGRTTAGTGTPELLTISGTGSVAMTNTPTLVTPVLGAATATSISVSGDVTLATGIVFAGGGVYVDSLNEGYVGIDAFGENLRLYSGNPIGYIATMPLRTGTVVVATTSATATQALFATATAGAPAYRAIASADIATALTTPGAIGGTTASTGAFTTLTGTSSATLGVNGGTGGSLVLRGSTSGSATINTSVTGVLALPSGTTATSMALTTPVLGTPSSGTLTSCTGLPVATGISGLGTGVATALALATNVVGGFATKLYREWNVEEMIAYNSGDVSKGANGSTQQGALFVPNATNYLKIPLTDMRFAGRTVRLRIICVTNVTEAANLQLFFEVDWRTTALDGATTEPVGVGYGTGGGTAETVTKAAPATSLRILSITSTSTWSISSTATYISVAFGRKASAGDDPTNIDNSTANLCVWSLILEEI